MLSGFYRKKKNLPPPTQSKSMALKSNLGSCPSVRCESPHSSNNCTIQRHSDLPKVHLNDSQVAKIFILFFTIWDTPNHLQCTLFKTGSLYIKTTLDSEIHTTVKALDTQRVKLLWKNKTVSLEVLLYSFVCDRSGLNYI